MRAHGYVKDGKVVLEEGEVLPEGARVAISVLGETADFESLRKGLLAFAGTIEGLPPDLSRNHDKYLYYGLHTDSEDR